MDLPCIVLVDLLQIQCQGEYSSQGTATLRLQQGRAFLPEAVSMQKLWEPIGGRSVGMVGGDEEKRNLLFKVKCTTHENEACMVL